MRKTSTELKQELYEVIQSIDPEETDSPSEKVVGVAHEVIDLVSPYLNKDVSIDLTGQGSVDIDWFLDWGSSLSILIENPPRKYCKNEDGSYAQVISHVWNNRGEIGSSYCLWNGKLPQGMRLILEWVVGRESNMAMHLKT